ncbi:hypothetical protein Bca101_059435 [Brassica carinata]
MQVVPGYSTRLENSVNAILSSANRENLPVLYPGPGDLLDTTTPTWFRFLSDLSLVIPSILFRQVEDIKSRISGMNKDISELRLNVAWLEKEIEGMKTALVRKGDKYMSEGRCLRNVVVCGVGMAILCYYYFFV